MSRLVAHIHQIGHAGLHSKSQFVLTDARCNLWIVVTVVGESIKFLHGIDDVSLLLLRHTPGIADV